MHKRPHIGEPSNPQTPPKRTKSTQETINPPTPTMPNPNPNPTSDTPDSQSDADSPITTAAPDSNIIASDSLSYWNNVSADVNGMLGGYPHVSRIDLQGSKNFIAKVRRLNSKASSNASTTPSTATASSTKTAHPPPLKKFRLAVDCGAGIGRITQGLLTHVADVVDIVEPIPKFAAVLEASPLHVSGHIGSIYVTGLEAWHPSKKYDLIWNQWCVGHLTDAQLTEYLRRAGEALAEGGWMVVKENLSTNLFGEDIFDDVDSSVTRSDAKFKEIFEGAGLDIIRMEVQSGFPKDLFPVKMYALRPR